jgi:hypothetical protein
MNGLYRSLTLRKEHRLRVFEKRMLRRIFRPKKRKWREAGEDRITRGFITCKLRKILLRWSNEEDGWGM